MDVNCIRDEKSIFGNGKLTKITVKSRMTVSIIFLGFELYMYNAY